MPFDHRRRPGGRFFLFPLIAILMALIMGGVVMLLWNFILAPVAHIGKLTYWQGVGLLVLSRILFGNFRSGYYRGRGFKGGPWRDKWIKMTPEERQQFRQEWEKRCGPRKESGEERP